jgi:hypothetical protein
MILGVLLLKISTKAGFTAYLFYFAEVFNLGHSIKGGDHLTMGYFVNLDNGFSNKYKNKIKIEITLRICSSTYRLMVIQISCNFIIV